MDPPAPSSVASPTPTASWHSSNATTLVWGYWRSEDEEDVGEVAEEGAEPMEVEVVGLGRSADLAMSRACSIM